jgi:hypothetical protein
MYTRPPNVSTIILNEHTGKSGWRIGAPAQPHHGLHPKTREAAA